MGEIIKKVLEYTESDVLEIFGETGSGKTTFAVEVLKEASAEGLKTVFIDTERNLSQKQVKQLDIEYIYAPSIVHLSQALHQVLHSQKHYDVFVVDSIGLPVLGMFAKMKLNEKGSALLKMQSYLYELKAYAFDHNTAVVITNQPESRWMKPEDHDLRPFGDKAMFFVKEIWKTYRVKSTPYLTECKGVAWRSRNWGKGMEIYRLTISSADGEKRVKVEWLI